MHEAQHSTGEAVTLLHGPGDRVPPVEGEEFAGAGGDENLRVVERGGVLDGDAAGQCAVDGTKCVRVEIDGVNGLPVSGHIDVVSDREDRRDRGEFEVTGFL